MGRRALERRIFDLQDRILRGREELAVLDEQLASFVAAAEEARIRSLVAETPLAARELHEAERHLSTMQRARAAAVDELEELERARDGLLEKFVH